MFSEREEADNLRRTEGKGNGFDIEAGQKKFPPAFEKCAKIVVRFPAL